MDAGNETGKSYDQYFPRVLECFTRANKLSLCDMGSDLKKCDPVWMKFMEIVIQQIPKTLCPAKQQGSPKYQGDHNGSRGG